MNVRLWGTRGSVASPGPDTASYGGNTACVEVRGHRGTVIVLDAGTGIRPLGANLPDSLRRVDVLLTHLHMDHIQGLGFLQPLYDEKMEVHIWGPASTTLRLEERLRRYLSPPLFPVRLRELACHLKTHEVPCGDFEIGEFRCSSALVCHPGPTVGFRLETTEGMLAYIPDHEPALGRERFPIEAKWTSGYDLAAGVDLLIHDAQYTSDEYPQYRGWGHSSFEDVLRFTELVGAKHLVAFHHDPAHTDGDLDRLLRLPTRKLPFRFSGGKEGAEFSLGTSGEIVA